MASSKRFEKLLDKYDEISTVSCSMVLVLSDIFSKMSSLSEGKEEFKDEDKKFFELLDIEYNSHTTKTVLSFLKKNNVSQEEYKKLCYPTRQKSPENTVETFIEDIHDIIQDWVELHETLDLSRSLRDRLSKFLLENFDSFFIEDTEEYSEDE